MTPEQREMTELRRVVKELTTQRDALAAKCAELEQDARRLDWLTGQSRFDAKLYQDQERDYWVLDFARRETTGDTLRYAIDAALTPPKT